MDREHLWQLSHKVVGMTIAQAFKCVVSTGCKFRIYRYNGEQNIMNEMSEFNIIVVSVKDGIVKKSWVG